ncbi:MAG: DUF4118 domain-containing protein [Candidatus Omnitrophica bacterium]|nr:DUF4118 domain-containing protein [Candidatus Omnitrophota bacterium]MCA9415540.1 DUF4118 domain-containing protein [Candidatus Omnitrophota bacterium]MCA9432337.1 DUF4118 domain-containing protein [Candidatus Omnitrophota bacterium]MCA9435512.1 DUF4118 domain-containing protein [Candidatus Omnitrophota bacterium]MCA9439417.1 DUF4118 domain-containing protein [Candidatus Omnitrophota bacterium]
MSVEFKSVLSVVLLTCFIGVVDYETGRVLNFFLFYFAPVILAAWFLGLSGAMVTSIVCSGVWFAADYLSARDYPSHGIAVWNTMIRMSAFMMMGASTSKIRVLIDRERELSERLGRTLAELKVLEGLVPICAACKSIRDENNQWHVLEAYITDHTNAQFTHGLCPKCTKKILEEAGLSGPSHKTETSSDSS